MQDAATWKIKLFFDYATAWHRLGGNLNNYLGVTEWEKFKGRTMRGLNS